MSKSILSEFPLVEKYLNKLPFTRSIMRTIKVILFTIRNSGKDHITVRAAGLTFYSMMAIVPMAAVVFGIAKGFDFDTKISNYLYTSFPQYEPMIDQVIGFGNALLERTKGGLLATIGFFVLLWSVIKVFDSLEDSFDNIWDVKKSRRWIRKTTDYVVFMLTLPIFWGITSSLSLNLETKILQISIPALSPILKFLLALSPYVISCIMFCLLYYLLPNTKVKAGHTIRAGIIAGIIFQVFQVFYFGVQSKVSAYNPIYGSFAVLPLFMIWLNTSWQIILFGAELSFAFQNIDSYEIERESRGVCYTIRKRLITLIMSVVARNFDESKPPKSSGEIAAELNMPVSLVREILFELKEAQLLLALPGENDKQDLYSPAKEVCNMRVSDVMLAVEGHGYKSVEMDDIVGVNKVDTLFEKMEKLLVESDENKRILDIWDGKR